MTGPTFRETVQITPFLIHSGHGSRREESKLRTTTEGSPGEAEGSDGTLARDARAVAAGERAKRRVRKTENATTCLRQGEEEEAEGQREQAAKKTRGPIQPCSSARSTHPDRGASDRHLSRFPPSFRRDQFCALSRDHRRCASSTSGSD